MLSIRQSQAQRPDTLIILLLLRFFEHITQVCLFIVKINQINIDYTRVLNKGDFCVLGNLSTLHVEQKMAVVFDIDCGNLFTVFGALNWIQI